MFVFESRLRWASLECHAPYAGEGARPRRNLRVGRAAIVAGVFAFTVGCSSRVPARNGANITCPKTDGLAEHAAAAAKAAFPGSLDPNILEKRLTYINHNLARLFDPDGTGYLDFQRYDDWQWTGTIIAVPSVRCAMDLHQYRNYLEGSDANIKQIEKYQPYRPRVDAQTFSELSSDGNYITREDLARQWSKPSFQNFDTNGDGHAPLDGKLAVYMGKERK